VSEQNTEVATAKATPKAVGPLHLSPAATFVRRSYQSTGAGPKDYNVCEISGALTDEERRAYGLLFAAAPELLAAAIATADYLAEMCSSVARHGSFSSNTEDLGRITERLMNAANAAEGRSHA
jgi:hypothetical protein